MQLAFVYRSHFEIRGAYVGSGRCINQNTVSSCRAKSKYHLMDSIPARPSLFALIIRDRILAPMAISRTHLRRMLRVTRYPLRTQLHIYRRCA